MTLAYFDCFSGASGDMILGALIDAGLSVDVLRARLAGLPLDGYALSAEKITKQGFAATQATVELDGKAAPHRHLADIVAIINAGGLPGAVRDQAVAIFEHLAAAEARAHGSSIDRVHFHEVGAVDAIVDVVGAVAGLHELGVTRVVCSPIPTGSGTVRCAHGVMPVPAPGTAALLEGIPLLPTDEPGELTTPTGAAILTTLAQDFGPIPAMTIERTGYGAGRRDGCNRPNLLRIFLGGASADGATDEVRVLECNLDDVPAETVGYCVQKLLDAGALDAYVVPITMKKSRPGVILSVLARPEDEARLGEIVFRETTTLGIRSNAARRMKLDRRHDTVETPFGPLRVKVGTRAGVTYTACPEHEDCRQAAEAHGVPLKTVVQAAQMVWEQAQGSGTTGSG
ncbi:MAG: nickel pincer cofactor biosynthesis protein LarC [bacterium]|nr:nickel pincer cofactor biosynthesis protein LarC [bacterium]